MPKNKNSRLLILFFLCIFLSSGVVVKDASAITTAGCQSAGGTCKPGATASCDPATENNSGSCVDSGSLSGLCCVPKTSAASEAGVIPAPASGTLNYTLLEKIPGFSSLNGGDLPGYVKALYKIALIIVTLSAVLMISIGGFMYITSAGNTSSMATAKGIIFDSLIGLIIALAAWLVLYVINPDLVNINITSFSPISVSQEPIKPAGQIPLPGTGVAGTCGGLTPQAAVNCADASPALSDLLTCMKLKGITASVTSIGDSAGFDRCKNNWSRPPCAHAKTSCHYGGGASKTTPECSKSMAADISVRNLAGGVDLSIANAVKAAASACGGRVNDETSLPGAPHIHISPQTSCCSL